MKMLLETLSLIDLGSLDIDEVLDARDSDPFDSEWMRVYNAVEALKSEETYPQTAKADISSIREAAFKTVYAMCDNSDLAGYTSDDFGLIADAELLGYKDPWLDKLTAYYREKRIPCGDI